MPIMKEMVPLMPDTDYRSTHVVPEQGRFALLEEPGLRSTKVGAALSVVSSPPPVVIEINEILRSNHIDLNKLGRLSRSYPAASAQILELCNSSALDMSQPAANLEEAAITMGAETLGTLTLAWGLVERAGKHLPSADAYTFWQHSLMVALVCERTAESAAYPGSVAYLAGLLHDIGRVPLLMAAACEDGHSLALLWPSVESTAEEQQRFGSDHCALGRRIGMAWGFSDLFLDVFSLHHSRKLKAEIPGLVRIVAMAEECLSRQVTDWGGSVLLNPDWMGRRNASFSFAPVH